MGVIDGVLTVFWTQKSERQRDRDRKTKRDRDRETLVRRPSVYYRVCNPLETKLKIEQLAAL